MAQPIYKPKPRPPTDPTPQPGQGDPGMQPFDATYQSGVAGAEQQYGNTMARIGYEQGRTKQEFGFDDTSNPFNRAAMLERSYRQGQRGMTNAMAGRGQLYSGATGRGLGEGTHQYNQSYDALRRQYQDTMQGYQFQGAEAATTRDVAQAGYQSEALDRASQILPPDPGAPPGAAPAPAQAARVHPTQTKDHAAAGLKRVSGNTYLGPNGTFWHRTASGTFARGKG